VEPGRARRNRILAAIALFKFAKAAVLVTVGIGGLRLLNPVAAVRIRHGIAVLLLHLHPRAMPAVEAQLLRLTHARLELFSILAFAWATLFAGEGFGLWKARRWAEWLTVVATSSFIPLECYGLIRHPTWPRLLTIVVNLLVVGYLLWKLGHLPGIASPRLAVPEDRALVSTRKIS
jgi:uncharacterized membrane protein (DUF2068 family)